MNNVAVLIIFAVLALVILVNLYNVLGRKVGFRSEDKALGAQKPNEIESGGKLERPAESRNPSLDALKARDVNFNETNFLEKARETYEQVVLAFHKGELEPVKDRLSEKVYASFSDAVAARTEAPKQILSFVESPKADIDTIEYKDEQAQLRVRFLSEMVYETQAGENGEAAQKLYRRAAEYWTFQRAYKNMNGSWILARVEAAKA
ncbi:Tim44/TimA family putative adaptor protein [Asticcacaulis sp. EMRT-3]|uniref:Tim44/TimA family putative adaptor protein n=1 Tax=Asticcacaulis sp. EMRT-3 TaxID=3040349 RepID=UPI0024AFFE25|nr:Tim44/TimA family putative adaptor protein [Asticcacaulis sp. EMRT-3]MDI7775832.1 Tim44/TimA family putative adaptor protein [Asticcacaulis sp. EMRT-3]